MVWAEKCSRRLKLIAIQMCGAQPVLIAMALCPCGAWTAGISKAWRKSAQLKREPAAATKRPPQHFASSLLPLIDLRWRNGGHRRRHYYYPVGPVHSPPQRYNDSHQCG